MIWLALFLAIFVPCAGCYVLGFYRALRHEQKQQTRFSRDLIVMLQDVDDGSGWDKETLDMVRLYAEESARQLGLLGAK